MLSIVTSCSLQGWKETGEACVDSLHRYWPSEVALHVVTEDYQLFNHEQRYAGRQVTFWDLLAHDPARQFLERHQNNRMARGKGAPTRRENHGYSFRHDAYKFSKKVFAIEQVAWAQRTGRLLWLDADTVTFTQVPLSLFAQLPPQDFALAHLARKNYHSECGFIGYNLDDRSALKFICDFAALYSTDQVFKLKEWHDSWVFDHMIKVSGIKAYQIPHTNVSHPFVCSVLGHYMDHKKGARKKLMHSPEHPILGKKRL